MTKRMLPRPALVVAGLLILAAATAGGEDAQEQVQVLEQGMLEPARLERLLYHIPRITANNDHDALFLLGWVHAEDRFFQMDVNRRLFSGTLAELIGETAISQDIQLRTLGLRRAAEASADVISSETTAWLEAYAEGVNAYLADLGNPLPPEYAELELSRGSIPPWTPLDSLTVAKGMAFGLSFDLMDLELTEALAAFEEAGAAQGFDGTALFYDDLYRSAPFDPAVSIPGSAVAKATTPRSDAQGRRPLPAYLNRTTRNLIARYRTSIEEIPLLRAALDHGERGGSNWWVVAGSRTESGFPVLANDPHLGLDTPAIFYEVHLRVVDSEQPMDVFGVSFPGSPAVSQGCTPSGCWGSTVNPMDVTDVYQEQLVVNIFSLRPTHTVFEGRNEPLVAIEQTYRYNLESDGTLDNLAVADVGEREGGITYLVPRRNNGPIIAVDTSNLFNITGLSVQYAGWSATREVDAFRIWARATGLDDFREGLSFFDVGSQNWAWADVSGDIGYFTSGEMPIREDLQNLGAADGGVPPFLVRDGTHSLQHEWLEVVDRQPNQSLPYEILAASEMPGVVNPASGYVLSANNDPIGTTLDNDPLNQQRAGGGVFYLNAGYASGFRMGRIQRLFDAALGQGGTMSVAQIRQLQSNNQLLDAEFFVPYIVTAFDSKRQLGSAAADSPAIEEAVGRLRTWDFSTPTGIATGYDPGDEPSDLPQPTQTEIDASIAATIYAVWRGQIIAQVIDEPLADLGLEQHAPPSDLAMTALRNIVENVATSGGVGVSGITFIPDGDLDGAVLQALSDALDLLASDAFADAFHHSTNQDDYRWGLLHRIVFDHLLQDPFGIPPAGNLPHLGEHLTGIARAGGFGAVDASSHSARADGVNSFMFGSGPARRFVGHITPEGIKIYQTIAGGASGVMGSPHQADALRLWLTNRYHERLLGGDRVRSAPGPRVTPR